MQLADMVCAALLAELQQLNLMVSCRFIFNVCDIYQCAYTNS